MDLKNLPAIIEHEFNQDETYKPNVLKPVVIGLSIIIVFLGGFFAWAFFSPLESSAIAPGQITVFSHRKTINHLEGGIVDKIFVKEGSMVKEGQPLIKLDETRASASLQLLRSQAYTLLAQEVRLSAQRDGDKTLTFTGLLDLKEPDSIVDKIKASQIALFKATQKTDTSTLEILDQRIEQLHAEIDSLKSQVKSSNRQLVLIKEELDAVKYLSEKGLIEKTRLLALMRETARLRGNRDENKALIARLEQRIGETKLQKLNYETKSRRDTLAELHQVQDKLNDTLERMKAAEDILTRTLVIAPLAGRVVDLKVHTRRGVISPREAIMDIVPKEDELVIEARINPLDIDVVREGLEARIQLTAYKQRNAPPLLGKVIHVSADSFEDPATGQAYFKAKISIDKKALNNLSKEVKLYPGMPAQVMIITDKRTPLEYFISPIQDSFERAFKED